MDFHALLMHDSKAAGRFFQGIQYAAASPTRRVAHVVSLGIGDTKTGFNGPSVHASPF